MTRVRGVGGVRHRAREGGGARIPALSPRPAARVYLGRADRRMRDRWTGGATPRPVGGGGSRIAPHTLHTYTRRHPRSPPPPPTPIPPSLQPRVSPRRRTLRYCMRKTRQPTRSYRRRTSYDERAWTFHASESGQRQSPMPSTAASTAHEQRKHHTLRPWA